MSGWQGYQRAQHPREGAASMRPDVLSGVRIDDRKPPSTSQRVDPCVLRARDSTGAVRPFSEAIGSRQAPSARRAVRLQGPQTGGAKQLCARGGGSEFEAERPKTHLRSSEKMLSSPTDPPRFRTSHHPAMLGVSHPGMGQIRE